jgi:hypothetical protein
MPYAIVNIRQSRDTRRLKAWLRAAKTVELRQRDKLIAKIVPEATSNVARGPSQSHGREPSFSQCHFGKSGGY